MGELINESGSFLVDPAGVLLHFEPPPAKSLLIRPDPRSLFCLHIPEGVRVLPGDAFRGYQVAADVTFPDSLEELGLNARSGAFSRCVLNRVVLPKHARVGENVFAGSSLGTAVIPTGSDPGMLRRIARALRFSVAVFPPLDNWPQELVDIFLGKDHPRESWEVLRNACGVFRVDPDGVLREFQGTPAGDRLRIPEGVAALSDDLFSGGDTALVELTLPGSLRSIGRNVFACRPLPDVVLPDHLETFGPFAFGGSRLASLTIPSSLRESLLPLNLRQFKDSYAGEIRVPQEFGQDLEDLCRKWWRGFTIREIEDPRLGPMCCAVAEHGMQRSGEVIPALLLRIAGAS